MSIARRGCSVGMARLILLIHPEALLRALIFHVVPQSRHVRLTLNIWLQDRDFICQTYFCLRRYVLSIVVLF